MFIESIIITNFLQTILHNYTSEGILYYFMSGFEYYFRNMLAGLFMSFYLIINFEKYHISQKIAWFMTLFSGRRNKYTSIHIYFYLTRRRIQGGMVFQIVPKPRSVCGSL